ncbi:MAG: hypothetical protein HQK55_05725 [Deltaproteobacteria bacterium]|nr:hypothetical protein [Deltaproteobacteria bacterium]
MVQLILCDYPTSIIRVMRRLDLSPDVILEIKAACDEQIRRYPTAAQVDGIIWEIEDFVSPEQMMDGAEIESFDS